MESVSYLRAGAACFPIIGPFVSVYNTIQLQTSSPLDVTDSVNLSLLRMRATLAALQENAEALRSVQNELETKKSAFKREYLPLREKAQIYCICGLVGNVLSIAATVGLVALGILGKVAGPIAIFSFAIQAVSYGLLIHSGNETIKQLRPL